MLPSCRRVSYRPHLLHLLYLSSYSYSLDYKNLERRVDALRNAHAAFLKIAKAYESEVSATPSFGSQT